ncbi:Na/Pi symporter [Oceanobacter mangrovi]|uniref:Na/Pi symporter n=1 Tax=Oceanobacter mangrovi TaxID=2862510 RepID=UPI001C8DEDD1|nr:Na/Pi symporter [Oceanobacter mangrovi]
MNDTTATQTSGEIAQHSPKANWLNWFKIVGLVYLLLIAVSMIGSGFKLGAGPHAKELFDFASNPLTGLIVGTVATALIQSSSTVTSIIVGLVAGGLPVEIAIPMIMGANIGTTITNTIVSLGHVRQGEEFRRAFAAATVHDFFNLLAVAIFLPLEIMFGVLDKIAGLFAGFLSGADSVSMNNMNFMKPLVKPPVDFVKHQMGALMPDTATGIVMVVLGIALIFGVITLIGKLLKSLMVGKAKEILHSAVGRGPLSGIASGTIMTVLVQSSSTTTSLIVPLAGSGVFSLRQIFPFTLGANIGTTVTALLAATAVTGGNAQFALQIALVHLIFNVLAVVVIYGLPFLRNIPLVAAERLAEAALKNKLYAGGYILTLFFIAPLVLIGGSQLLGL